LALKKNTVNLSQNLLSAFGSLKNLNQKTGTKIYQIKFIGAAKSAKSKPRWEVRKRMVSKYTGVKIKLKSSQTFVKKFFHFLKNIKKEIVKIVLLDPKLKLIKDLTISKGSLNARIFQPKKVMNPTIRESSISFPLSHNHPNGDSISSQK
jgi:DNA repair protein RadC